jgi:hypothetical protein
MAQVKFLVLLAFIIGLTLQYQNIRFAKSLVNGSLNASFDQKNKKVALEDTEVDLATIKTSLSDSANPEELVKGFGLFNTNPETSVPLVLDGSMILLSGKAQDYCKEADGCTIDPEKRDFNYKGFSYIATSLTSGQINSFPKLTPEIAKKIEQKAPVYFVGE